MKKFLVIPFILLLLLQSILYRSYGQTSKLRFEHLTIKDGLSNNSVYAILQDRKGYIWFGTADGLNKYDGYSFTTYEHNPQDTTSLVQNSIFSLWEDGDEAIWLGTAAGGISKFDRSTENFTHYQPEPDTNTFVPPLRAVSAVNEDSEGYLWVGNYLGELRRFDKRSGKFFPENYNLGYRQIDINDSSSADSIYNIRSRDVIYCLYKDRSGTLWVGNNSGLHQLHLIPRESNQPSEVKFKHFRHQPGNPKSLSHNTVTSIYEDKAGVLWVGTGGGGLNRMDREKGVFSHYRHEKADINSISSNELLTRTMAEDQAGNLWIGTGNGLNKLNQERTEFTRYMQVSNDPASLTNNTIYSLAIDRSDILWVGTFSEGIDKLDLHQKPFNLYRHNPTDANSLSNDTVTSIISNKQDVIWIGTWGGGLNAFHKKTGKFTHYRHKPDDPQSLRSDRIYAIVEDTDGNFWIRHNASLSSFNPNTGAFKHYLYNKDLYKLFGRDGFVTMYADREGLLWFGTQNGLKSFDPEKNKIIHYRHNPANQNGLSDHVVNAIFQDKRGYIWIGHGSVGLSRLDKNTGTFTHYLPDPLDATKLSTSIVYSIYEDSNGIMWFGTRGGGLCRFDPETEVFTTYTKAHGLADNTITSILEDKENTLWLVTGKGISRFSLTTNEFINYDAGDGVSRSILSRTSSIIGLDIAGFVGSDGTLYYGGTEGMTVFDPRQVKPNQYVPPVVITRFKLFDKLVPGKDEAEEIILKHDENFFSFEFSALNFTNTSKNQYAYQLVGIDKDWVHSGTRRISSYTEVGPGEYVFRVKGSNNDGIWNNEGTLVRILIQPPWWRTKGAYVFYALCFLAGLVAVDRFQRQRLIGREREKVRERELAQARKIEKAYHELKQTQTQLVQKEKMASLGELTAGVAHEIQNPLNFVNNFSEVSKEMCNELKEELIAGHQEEATALAEGLSLNLDKIQHHGLRADAIVKGMLQHARSSSGEKQPTDINALAYEFLRLTYHGYKIKHKDFAANLITDFNPIMENVEVVPQELGSVLLNLYNNAFYATGQKKAKLNGQYEPEVYVSTQLVGDKVAIRVKDNGIGIPDKLKDKIFQPFFTTKPSGQGTGLGLSLSYDIITKGHGGELQVESREGEYTEFIITIPAIATASA